MAIAAGKLMNIKEKKDSPKTKPSLMMMPGQATSDKGTEPAEDQAQSQGQSGILEDLKVIHEKTLNIEDVLRKTLKIQKEDVRDQRFEANSKKRKSSENALETAGRKAGNVGKGLIKPLKKGLDLVKNFILNTLLGALALKLLKFLPQLINFLGVAEPVFNWIEEFAGKLLGAVAGFIEFGYKAVDAVKGVVTNIFGEDGAKAFDTFTSVFTKFANLAMIVMMAASDMKKKPGEKPKGKGKGKTPKWKKNLANKFKKTGLGKRLRNLKARRLRMRRGLTRFRRGITRGTGRFANRAMGGLNRFVERGAKGAFRFARRGAGAARRVGSKLASKGASKIGAFAVKLFGKAAKFIAPALKTAKPFVSKFFGKIPIVGPLVVGIVSVVSGEPLGKALFRTLGAALGGALGTFIPIPVLGTLIGETIGVFVGDMLYEGLMGKGWKAVGQNLRRNLMKIFSAGKAVFKWITGGFNRFYEKIPKFKIPDLPEKAPKWIPGFGFGSKEKIWNAFKIGIKVLIGPLSLLMGKKIPNLLWLVNPLKTAPALVKSFFPPNGVASSSPPPSMPLMSDLDSSNQDTKNQEEQDRVIASKIKQSEKIKQLSFKVERISLSSDVAAVSEEASYEGQTTEIVKINKIVEKSVSVGSGGDKSSSGSSNSGTIDNRMEAALA